MSAREKIIYVDDENENVMLFSIYFSKNFDVITGYSAIEGLDLLSNNSDAKFIISDFKMPGMNGLEFIKKAKELYPDKSYYILSGYDITAEINDALNKKIIQQYFRKPIRMNEIEKVFIEI